MADARIFNTYFYNEMALNRVNDSSYRDFESAVSKSHEIILINNTE